MKPLQTTKTLAETHEALWLRLEGMHKDMLALGVKKPEAQVSAAAHYRRGPAVRLRAVHPPEGPKASRGGAGSCGAGHAAWSGAGGARSLAEPSYRDRHALQLPDVADRERRFSGLAPQAAGPGAAARYRDTRLAHQARQAHRSAPGRHLSRRF